jgi:hypothetical protein
VGFIVADALSDHEEEARPSFGLRAEGLHSCTVGIIDRYYIVIC